MSNPKISIIVPFYNVRKHYFDRCLESVLNQTFEDFELIIVNDGSEDDYSDYLNNKCNIDTRIAVYHTKNHGVSEARNYGINQAKGDTVCFVDADDYVAPWMLQDLWTAYSSNEVEAAASYYTMVCDDVYTFQRTAEKPDIVDAQLMKNTALIGVNCNPEPFGYLSAGPVAVLFKINIVKMIPFPRGIRYMEDVIWNYKFFSACKQVAIVKECIYAYRQNNESATHTCRLDMISERIKALSIIRDLCGENDEWYALRVLASYSICCKCCMQTNEITGFNKKMNRFRVMNKDPVWKAFNTRGISRHWDKKYRLKKIVANIGLMPIFYYFHK